MPLLKPPRIWPARLKKSEPAPWDSANRKDGLSISANRILLKSCFRTFAL